MLVSIRLHFFILDNPSLQNTALVLGLVVVTPGHRGNRRHAALKGRTYML